MAGPATVIVAGLTSAWLAIATDGGVSTSEYRLGLAIGQTLGRICSTAALGYRSDVSLEGGRFEVTVTGGNAPPYLLRLRLAHPTRAGVERIVELETVGKGQYRVSSSRLPSGRWLIFLEDEAGIWRMGGEWELASGQPLKLL